MPSTFGAVRSDQSVRQQVQAQVGVVARRRACRPATRSSCARTTVSTSRSSSRPASSRQVGRDLGHREPRRARRAVARPTRGSGNHVSRTVPSAAMVATPTPDADSHASQGYCDYREGCGPGLARRSDRVDRGAGGHPQRVARRAAHRRRGRGRAARADHGFEIIRNGDAVLARTNLGRPTRVMLAGHLDTVPAADNVPSRLVDGDASRLRHVGHEVGRRGVPAPGRHRRRARRTTSRWSCTTARRSSLSANGLGRIERELPDWLHADVAILGRAVGRIHRGGLSGHLRVVVTRRRDAGAFRAIVVGRQRHSQAGRGARPAGGLSGRAASTSTAAPTAKGCPPSASTAASRATSSPTRRRSPSTSGSRPTAASSRPPQHVRDVLDGLDVDDRTDRRRIRRAARSDQTRRRRAGRRPPVGRCARSTAGPTWRGSRRSASPRSTTAPATRTSRTASTSAWTSTRSPRPPRCCGKYLLTER